MKINSFTKSEYYKTLIKTLPEEKIKKFQKYALVFEQILDASNFFIQPIINYDGSEFFNYVLKKPILQDEKITNFLEKHLVKYLQEEKMLLKDPAEILLLKKFIEMFCTAPEISLNKSSNVFMCQEVSLMEKQVFKKYTQKNHEAVLQVIFCKEENQTLKTQNIKKKKPKPQKTIEETNALH